MNYTNPSKLQAAILDWAGTVVDNAKRDRIENFESVNESYVIEDLGCAAMAENITLD